MKDARPSRWLAPLERPRWPQHRPRVAPPAKPSLSAVEFVELAGGEPPRGQQRSVVKARRAFAEITRFAQIAEIAGLTAQGPTPPGDHHHPCPKVRTPAVVSLFPPPGVATIHIFAYLDIPPLRCHIFAYLLRYSPSHIPNADLCISHNPAANLMKKKERKKTDNPREGWEDGTPPPHRDFKEGTVWC